MSDKLKELNDWLWLHASQHSNAGIGEKLKEFANSFHVLRTEVARLKEELENKYARIKELEEALANSVNADWHNTELAALIQQLAAANAKIDELQGGK